MRNRIARRVTGLVVYAGAIVLETTWVCTAHGTVNAQGSKCPECAS
jgi:hypothetical protein